jgi:DNA-binding NtrC family response regulator
MPNKRFSILVVDDDQSVREILGQLLQVEGYTVGDASNGVEAINALQSTSFDIALLDIFMPHVNGMELLKHCRERYPDMWAIMLTGASDVQMAVECMQLGAFSYLTKPYNPKELLTVIDNAIKQKRLILENRALRYELSKLPMIDELVGRSKAFIDIMDLVGRVAPSDSTVLIEGASGTGKELVANYLHRHSLRKDHQFVVLNCASIPETLIESELFGHERGSFTDAIATKPGLVEIAAGGTLFLDEVAEISLMIQPKLLRFLQTGEFRRIGGNKLLNSDVRIISATNCDLRQEMAAGHFREDLLYRLNVITLVLPALRSRKDDIPLLVEHFLQKRVRTRTKVTIDDAAMTMLVEYEWPGNVRELENVIERAAILCADNIIRSEDIVLPLSARSSARGKGNSEARGPHIGDAISMREIEKLHMQAVLDGVHWDKNLAAKILNISLKTLYTKIHQHQLVERRAS